MNKQMIFTENEVKWLATFVADYSAKVDEWLRMDILEPEERESFINDTCFCSEILNKLSKGDNK